MPSPTPELPEWMQIQIKKWASENAQTEQHAFDEVRYCALIDGATEYAALYLYSERRRKEAMELLEPILDWGQGNPELKLGTSITKEVLERAKGFSVLRDALQKIYDLPGYRQDEASQLASEALALFPVDKKKEEETNERLSDETYTYYRIDYEDCSLEHDYIIVESLEDIIEGVRIVYTDLDDPTRESKVIITGVGLTPKQFNNLINIE